jgi:hypothetical protein
MKLCWLAACVVFSLQSLADVAREEAERRRRLDEQGIEAKTIVYIPQKDGIEAVSTGSGRSVPDKVPRRTGPSEERKSTRNYRTAIQKLDRVILQTEERLESRRKRLESSHREIPKTGRGSSRGNSEISQSRLKDEIEDLEIKLRQLRQERFETYQAGKKAGFLPGELDGKGIIP